MDEKNGEIFFTPFLKIGLIKKNRFDETYYENFDCEWYGEEYKLAKKKSPEEIIKQSGEKIKIEN